MSSTTRFGLRAPDGPENADVPLYIRNLASDVDPWLSRAQPRTQAQITAIASPLSGQQVFNTDLGKTQEWNGSVWRSIGAGAYGRVSQSVTVTASTWSPVSFFVGLGYSEVEFTWNGAGGNFVFRALVSASAGNAQVIAQGSSTILALDIPADATIAATAGQGGRQARNLRLGTDGFVRFELFQSADNTSTHLAAWRAR